LQLFIKDYPETKAFFVYGGDQEFYQQGIHIIPVNKFLQNIQDYLH
jgi:hypothetical protein